MFDRDTLLQERYRIIGPLGQGGMAAVYLARHVERNALVAIKALHPDAQGRLATGPVRQFRDEARMMSRLQHPNIPAFHEFLEIERHLCFVMEYVPGRRLDQVQRADAPLEEARVLYWARQLGEVLEYLHAQDPPIIFRDLKPGNVMLGEGEQVKLIDFGIAKFLDEHLKRSTQTTARGMLSRGYAALEQYVGGTDARSDVYSLGATLYNLLTGEPPPESLAVASGRAAAASVLDLRPDLSARTAQAMQAMMQVDRSCRPASIRQTMEALGFSLATPLPPRPRTPVDFFAGAGPEVVVHEVPSATSGPPTEQWSAEALSPFHPTAGAAPPQKESTTGDIPSC